AEVQIKLVEEILPVTMAVEKAWQHVLALGIDHLCARRDGDLAHASHSPEAAVLDHHHGILDRRAPSAVDQRATLHHNGLGVSGAAEECRNGKGHSCQAAPYPFVPAKAGTQCGQSKGSGNWPWIPAFAGTNGECGPI